MTGKPKTPSGGGGNTTARRGKPLKRRIRLTDVNARAVARIAADDEEDTDMLVNLIIRKWLEEREENNMVCPHCGCSNVESAIMDGERVVIWCQECEMFGAPESEPQPTNESK